MEYHRPKSVPEALELLGAGVPLGGGTALTPRRYEVQRVVDLGDLGLGRLEEGEGVLIAGAGVTLQTLVESEHVPDVLTLACMQEAGWNLRNAATLGGAVMAADGRSPLLTVLLALDTRLAIEPGRVVVGLDELLDRRAAPEPRLIVEARLARPAYAGYRQVGRSPADRPIVCAAVARLAGGVGGDSFRVSLGGYGERPVRVREAEAALEGPGEAQTAAEAAARAYGDAGDAWAGAEYRSEVAGVLVGRLAEEALRP